MRQSPLTIGATALLVLCLAAAVCRADTQDAQSKAGHEAGAFIQNLETRAINVLGSSVPSNERTATFRRLLSDDFDLPGVARFVLGPYGRELTATQRQEFVTLFRDALAEAYADRLGQYAGAPFRVTSVRPAGDATMVVGSEVMRRDGAPVRIDWQVIRRNGSFLIADVKIDGVSQKLAQRNTFIGIIQRNGGQPNAVIAALRQQLQGTPADPSAASRSPLARR
jgi:phospholipid transport system substrate-binding protein